MIDLLLKGGDVIDPSQNIRGKLDVAVESGTIQKVAPDIRPGPATRVVDVSGKFVVPGLIDLHSHIYEGVNQTGVNPDLAGVYSGVTTLVDAGSATSAAPIYYPTAKVGDRYLIDGGIVANNPVLHGYAEIKKKYPRNKIKILSVGTGLNKRSLKGKASQKWGLIGWLMHDLFGLMLESSLDHEVAREIIGKDYLRVNSPLDKVNRRLDDNNKKNLDKIRKMGDSWWEKFGDSALELLS